MLERDSSCFHFPTRSFPLREYFDSAAERNRRSQIDFTGYRMYICMGRAADSGTYGKDAV